MSVSLLCGFIREDYSVICTINVFIINIFLISDIY